MFLFAPVAMFVLPLAVFIVFRTLLWILAGFRGEMA
jgi:hypothetical protein